MSLLTPLRGGWGDSLTFRVTLKGMFGDELDHGQGVSLTTAQVASLVRDWLDHRRWPTHPCGLDHCPLAVATSLTVEVNHGPEAN